MTRQDHAVANLIFNIHEDLDSRNRPIFGITPRELSEERIPLDMFLNQNFISYRELFNNLDGDRRADTDVLNKGNAGAIVSLAGASLLYGYEDDEEIDIPPHILEFLNTTPHGEYSEFIDYELDQITMNAYDNICSFLFGRVLNTDIDENLHYDVHNVITDILWMMVQTLSSIVASVEDLYGSVTMAGKTAYSTAYWDVDYLQVVISKDVTDRDSMLEDYLKDRGYLNEKQDNVHRRRR